MSFEKLISNDIVQSRCSRNCSCNKTCKVKHDFAYTGLVHCGHCGCPLVGEPKKGKYVYYHCTGNRGKCPEPYTRQEALAREFEHVVRIVAVVFLRAPQRAP